MTTTVPKTVSFFDPLASLGPAACERHYTRAHTPWARRMLRDRPEVVTYHTARATARYDLGGRFRQRPSRWRYVFIRLRPGATLAFEPELRATIDEDHRHFLQDYRGFAGTEELLVDRRSGQPSFVAYVFEFDRHPDRPAPDLAARAGAVLAAAPAWTGLRAAYLDRVATEAAVGPIDVPGQRPLGRPRESTAKLGFLELYFDQREWAERWLADGPARALFTDPSFAAVVGHRVRLSTGVDKR